MPNQSNKNSNSQQSGKNSSSSGNSQKSNQSNQSKDAKSGNSGSASNRSENAGEDTSEEERRQPPFQSPSYEISGTDSKIQATGQPADTNVNASHRELENQPR